MVKGETMRVRLRKDIIGLAIATGNDVKLVGFTDNKYVTRKELTLLVLVFEIIIPLPKFKLAR